MIKPRKILQLLLPKEILSNIRFSLSHKILRIYHYFALFFLSIFAVFFEGSSVAVLYPIIDLLIKQKPSHELAKTSLMWEKVVASFGFINIDVTTKSLLYSAIILFITRQCFAYAKVNFTTRIAQKLTKGLQDLSYKLFLEADYSFTQKTTPGYFSNLITREATGVGIACKDTFTILGDFLMIVALGSLSILNSPKATISIFIVALILISVTRKNIFKTRDAGRRITKLSSTLNSYLLDQCKGVKLIKLAHKEERSLQDFKEKTKSLYKLSTNIAKFRALNAVWTESTVLLLIITTIFVSVEVFHMALTSLAFLSLVFIRMMPFLKTLISNIQTLHIYVGSAETVMKFTHEAKRSNAIKDGHKPLLDIKSAIEFREVSFTYPLSDKPALDHISLKIPARKIIALVGKSGAGKSTLVDLIPRFYDPQEGEILIDGVKNTEFTLATLRHTFSYIPQSGSLFQGTIAENISYYDDCIDRDRVVEAAKIACAHQFIEEMPNQYETQIGEGAKDFSGGEKQRIHLARALYHNCPVIIMDEPTSALDSETEQYISRAIQKVKSQKPVTFIIIAHRLSTIRAADQIFVLNNGMLEETGNHIDLLKNPGWYQMIDAMQAV